MMSSVQAKPALVVVDVQNGFVTKHSRHVVEPIAELVRRWQADGRDVVFTRFLNRPGSPFERLIKWTKVTDSPETDIVDELAALSKAATAVVDKNMYTLFNEAGTALVEAYGWTDLYVCGIDTEVCVLKTAVDAFEHDITPWLIKDASASHSGLEAHEAGLLVARKFIGSGQIISLSDVP